MVSAEGPIDPAPRFAIVGYAARFPGAPDADAFWDLLREGRDAVTEVPKDRWDVDEFFDPEPGVPGKVVTRRAGFVDDVTGFDAPFFGMSTREVRMLDPQHRLLLQTTWHAVEHWGTAPSALAGTNTRGQSVEAAIGRAIFDCNVAAFDVARLFEALSNRTDQSIIELEGAEQADQRHGRLLRVCGQRPADRCTTKKRNERAPLHNVPRKARIGHLAETTTLLGN